MGSVDHIGVLEDPVPKVDRMQMVIVADFPLGDQGSRRCLVGGYIKIVNGFP